MWNYLANSSSEPVLPLGFPWRNLWYWIFHVDVGASSRPSGLKSYKWCLGTPPTPTPTPARGPRPLPGLNFATAWTSQHRHSAVLAHGLSFFSVVLLCLRLSLSPVLNIDPKLLVGPFGAVSAGTARRLAYDEARSSTREVTPSLAFCAFKVSLPISVVVLSSGKLCYGPARWLNFSTGKIWEAKNSAIPSSIFCS